MGWISSRSGWLLELLTELKSRFFWFENTVSSPFLLGQNFHICLRSRPRGLTIKYPNFFDEFPIKPALEILVIMQRMTCTHITQMCQLESLLQRPLCCWLRLLRFLQPVRGLWLTHLSRSVKSQIMCKGTVSEYCSSPWLPWQSQNSSARAATWRFSP